MLHAALIIIEIREIDLDGSEYFTQVKSVQIKRAIHFYDVFPNPSNGTVYIETVDGIDMKRIEIHNVEGRKMYAHDMTSSNSAGHVIRIQTELPNGVYYLVLEDDLGSCP